MQVGLLLLMNMLLLAKIDVQKSLKYGIRFGCSFWCITTGFGVIENNAKLKIGESIVVFGAGGIGLNIIQAAKLNSAWPIIAVDILIIALN